MPSYNTMPQDALRNIELSANPGVNATAPLTEYDVSQIVSTPSLYSATGSRVIKGYYKSPELSSKAIPKSRHGKSKLANY